MFERGCWLSNGKLRSRGLKILHELENADPVVTRIRALKRQLQLGSRDRSRQWDSGLIVFVPLSSPSCSVLSQ
jgi:hypothetical protein